MRKFLYSPDYGAGWSTWAHGYEQEHFLMFYQPIIDYLEAGGTFGYDECAPSMKDDGEDYPNAPAVLKQLLEDWKERFPHDYPPYLGGARDLVVETCSDDCQIEITEYDGKESFRLTSGWH